MDSVRRETVQGLTGSQRRLGVRVNAVAPAWLPSEMTGGLEDPEQVAWISERNALGRPGRPHELDGAIAFLASDAASYITGRRSTSMAAGACTDRVLKLWLRPAADEWQVLLSDVLCRADW